MEDLTRKDLEKVVDRLIGATNPCGTSEVDKVRLHNAKLLISLVDYLTDEIIVLSEYRNNHEHSMKTIGLEAVRFMTELKKKLTDYE
jgi:hypothetical protein